ncbi:hypothetical protein RhiirB3_462047, partial [Rhizophagus irregularis]
LDILSDIAYGLYNIHKVGLTHQDFHSGNILKVYSVTPILLIWDYANQRMKVLPHVAPEIVDIDSVLNDGRRSIIPWHHLHDYANVIIK